MNLINALQYWKKVCRETTFCARCSFVLICQGARKDLPEAWSDQIIDDLNDLFEEEIKHAERN